MRNKIYFAMILTAMPIFAFAKLEGVTKILDQVKTIVDKLIPLAFSLAVLFFFWGLVKYIRSEGESKVEGKQIMVWGVIALFVMTSVWGLVKFIGDSFGLDANATGKIPTISK